MVGFPNFRIKWYVVLVALVFGVFILTISLANASLASLNQENNLDRFRINPVEFEIERNGCKEMVKYNLPQIHQIPGSGTYWIKDIRDLIWVNLSSKGKKDKADLYLLLADKKIAEVVVLSQSEDDKRDEIYKAALKAVSYLKQSEEIANEMDNIVEKDKLLWRIDNAKYFYKELFSSIGKLMSEDSRYEELKETL